MNNLVERRIMTLVTIIFFYKTRQRSPYQYIIGRTPASHFFSKKGKKIFTEVQTEYILGN